MRSLLVRRKCAFVRVDVLSTILIPTLIVTVAIIVGHGLISIGAVKSIYSSPFVALSAFVSNRVCLRAGLLTALLSVGAHEFFFAAPYWALNGPSAEQGLAYCANFAAAYLVARRVPVPPAPPMITDGDTPLPFLETRNKSDPSFWVVVGGQNWTDDIAVGSEYGRIYLDRARGAPLVWIVRDMVRAGRWTGVEAGFCSVVGRAAAGERRRSIPHDDADDRHRDGAVV